MKNLTARYSFTQFAYYAGSTGASSFATAFLLSRGLSSSLVGALLAVAGLLSCLSQPLIASMADRAKRYVVNEIALLLAALCAVLFLLQLLPGLPALAAGLLYMAGNWSSDSIVPLMNTINVAYSQPDYQINFGISRGIGSIASATSALVTGHILASFGTNYMLGFILLFRILCAISLMGYPRLQKPATQQRHSSCSVFQFFRRYKWFCLSLLGIALLGMYLAMTENYLIAILGRLGGDSGHVGTALFISAAAASLVIFFFGKLHARFSDAQLLKIAAVTFLVRAVLFMLARSISAIYLIQLLHASSYALLAPTQVYFAEARVLPADLVKGQSFMTVAYTLGCSGGTLIGGLLLNLGVTAILLAGIIMAAVGTAVLFLTANRTDAVTCEG